MRGGSCQKGRESSWGPALVAVDRLDLPTAGGRRRADLLPPYLVVPDARARHVQYVNPQLLHSLLLFDLVVTQPSHLKSRSKSHTRGVFVPHAIADVLPGRIYNRQVRMHLEGLRL